MGNVLFSVPLAGVIAESPKVTTSTFLTSVNPLPGSLTGWDQISGDLRVNVNTPFSGLGELGALGLGWLMAYCLVVGAVLTGLQRVIRSLPTSRSLIAFVGCAGLTTLFAASLMQYNLRSDTRLMWYAIAFVVAMRFSPAAQRSTRRPQRSRRRA